MSHSILKLNSVLDIRFYFPTFWDTLYIKYPLRSQHEQQERATLTMMTWQEDLTGWPIDNMTRFKMRQWQHFNKPRRSDWWVFTTENLVKENLFCSNCLFFKFLNISIFYKLSIAVKNPGQPWVCWRSDGLCLQVCERQQGDRHWDLLPIHSQDR